MEGDPESAGQRGCPFMGLEEEGEFFSGEVAPNGLHHFQAADDFVLIVIGQRVGEQGVEPFIDPGCADDLGGAQQ